VKPLSASQISTFLSCQRAWSFAYIDGIRSPNTPSTLLGSAIHKEMEDWLTHSKRPTSPQAALLMSHAPAPGVAAVEQPVKLTTPNSEWRGFIDVAHDLEADGTPTKLFTTGHTVIQDWKTSGNLSYAKSAQHLAEEDPQAALYAQYAYSYGATKVSGKWVYVTTKGKLQVKPVTFDFDREKVQKTVDALDETAAVVQKLYTLRKKTAELPQSLDHCNAYGGCFHRETCYKSPMAQSKETVMSDSPNAFMDFVNARFAPTNAVPPPPPAPPAFAPAPPSIPPTSLAFEGAENSDPDARAKAFIAAIPPPPSFAKPATPVPPAPPAPLVVDLNDGRPKAEHGIINSPEGGEYAPSSPEEAAVMVPVVQKADTHVPDELDTMDRDSLKRVCVALGLATESSRYQEPRLRSMIREFAQKEGKTITETWAGTWYCPTESETDRRESRATLENTQLTEEEIGAIKTATKELVNVSDVDYGAAEAKFRQIVREELRAFFGSLGK
jgi:RecB family exonuclease